MRVNNQKGDGGHSGKVKIIPINDVSENNLIVAEQLKIENEKNCNGDDGRDRELPSSLVQACL